MTNTAHFSPRHMTHAVRVGDVVAQSPALETVAALRVVTITEIDHAHDLVRWVQNGFTVTTWSGNVSLIEMAGA